MTNARKDFNAAMQQAIPELWYTYHAAPLGSASRDSLGGALEGAWCLWCMAQAHAAKHAPTPLGCAVVPVEPTPAMLASVVTKSGQLAVVFKQPHQPDAMDLVENIWTMMVKAHLKEQQL